jgi:thioredoxin 1
MIEVNHAGDRPVIAATAGLHPSAVVIEFWAECCKPCKAMAFIIGELAHEYQGRIKIEQMNVAENQETPARFGIRSIPALIFFKRGEAKQVIVGSHSKSHIEEELMKLFWMSFPTMEQ